MDKNCTKKLKMVLMNRLNARAVGKIGGWQI
ncbi:hypothetical protein ABID39_000322 [Bartonella japonica]|uniref:Uncharacterized protein n=1 Tax=Bartonella japonica TaxID=357761 RepID=A0ABV2FM90_9HYPH